MAIQPIAVPLSKTAEENLCRFLRNRVRSIRDGLAELHTELLPKWRKAYQATPAEKIREFPFHNASNIVVPVIAIHADTLLARVMAAIIKVRPLWVSRLVGEFPPGTEELRTSLETFMADVGLEPTELDLYRVYHEWFGGTIREGTGIVKSPWVKMLEDSIRVSGDGSFDYERHTLYEGPRPEKVALEDFGIDPHEKTLEAANFKYHVVRLQRFDLEERGFRRIYDPEKVKTILATPDRTTRRAAQQEMESDIGARTVSGYGFAEWDVYECHFRYKLGQKYVKIIAAYHEKTDTILRAFFHYYPSDIFVAARLFYRDDFFFGYGFAEMLWPFQEEVSQIHNQRRDNATVKNASCLRADPDSPLHRGYKTFPGAVIPGRKDEVEAFPFGQGTAQSEIAEESQSLDLADRRSGVSPPQQGFGAGGPTKKGGYSAMGTLSLLQEGNSRSDLNTTDIRYAHTKLGRILTEEYAEFGIGDRAQRYGQMGAKLSAALKLISDGKLRLPVTASTASVNREVEKQNDIMLTAIMQKHYGAVVQMLQLASNQMMPQEVKVYVTKASESATRLMREVLRHFDYDEVETLVPEAIAKAGTLGVQAPAPNAGAPPGLATSAPQQPGGASPLPGGLGPGGLGASPEQMSPIAGIPVGPAGLTRTM